MPLIAVTPVEEMEGPYARRWWALGVLCLSLLLVLMANTSLVVAAADMVRSLGLDDSDLQWVIDGYTVPCAALLLVFGAIGDKYSRRGALNAGLLIFAAGSVMGSTVDSVHMVIASRAVMGIGGAVIMPATLSLLVAMFPAKERTRAITVWTAASGLAVVLGPLLAGLLLERHSWSSTFLINVPLALVAMVAAMVLVPPSKARGMGRLDLVGGLLSIVTLGSLVYMIIEGPNFGWGVAAISAAVVAAVGLAAFVWWELNHPNPVLNLSMFRNREFTGATLVVVLFFLGVFGTAYYTLQHLQFVLGYSPLETGMRLLPLAGTVFVGAGVTSWLAPKIGIKATAIMGMLLGAAGVFSLVPIDSGSTYRDFLPMLTILGLAVGLSLSPCVDAIMRSFPEKELGVGGGVNDTCVELGGTLGVAILGSLLATSYKDNLTDAVGGQLPPAALDAAKESIGTVPAVAHQVAQNPLGGPQAAKALLDAANSAFSDAVSHTSVISGAILVLGAAVIAVVLPGRRARTRGPRATVAERAEAISGGQ